MDVDGWLVAARGWGTGPQTRGQMAQAVYRFYASKPNHSGSRMTGTGGIKTCSGGPVACTSEADLEYYNEFSSMWYTAGTSRQTKCAPPLWSSTAASTCENRPGDPNVAWRTTTVGTLVSSGGSAGSGTVHSPVLYVPCA